ncbi:MAG: cyclophilin-like fold protein [Armatimonadota bacterium]|nr:cyclophilin-like fold protein [Armatimonadota bacterium]
MAKIVRITTDRVTMLAELNETVTASKVWDALPIEAHGNTWGDEIYFGIPVHCDYENPREIVDLGDLAYWPPGNAFCIFFGRTPASHGDEIRPASAVNVFGKLLGSPEEFKSVPDGANVLIERAGSE